MMTEIEIWKSVDGYEGLYEVSNLGRIKRIASARGTKTGYIFAPSVDTKGYLRTRLTDKNGKAKTVKVHRIVAIAFHPNPENLPQVNHKDTDKQNNKSSNLEWCTNIKNAQHAKDNGLLRPSMTGKFGKDHNRSIKIIARNIDTGEEIEFIGINEAARELKTNAAAIWRVKTGEYKHTKRWSFS
jgi:hypothetical protein